MGVLPLTDDYSVETHKQPLTHASHIVMPAPGQRYGLDDAFRFRHRPHFLYLPRTRKRVGGGHLWRFSAVLATSTSRMQERAGVVLWHFDAVTVSTSSALYIAFAYGTVWDMLISRGGNATSTTTTSAARAQ